MQQKGGHASRADMPGKRQVVSQILRHLLNCNILHNVQHTYLFTNPPTRPCTCWVCSLCPTHTHTHISRPMATALPLRHLEEQNTEFLKRKHIIIHE
mmetsp:Transcript_20684/g.36934  ORF Transcript_20684/g.36934 Transcript_20684/m.36934 type:complete len:97 (+) Transcript_20684:1396-1686(+)